MLLCHLFLLSTLGLLLLVLKVILGASQFLLSYSFASVIFSLDFGLDSKFNSTGELPFFIEREGPIF